MESKEIWVDRNEAERVRIAVNEFNEKWFVDVRTYYQADNEEWRPTKKGVNLPIEKLDEFKEAVAKL